MLYTCSCSDLLVFLSRVGVHIGRFWQLVRLSLICKVTSKITFSSIFSIRNTLHEGWIAQISILNSCSSILLTYNRKLFKTVLGLHWIPQPISILFVVTKPGSKCCQLPSKAPEEDREEEKEATVSLAAARLTGSFIRPGGHFIYIKIRTKG